MNLFVFFLFLVLFKLLINVKVVFSIFFFIKVLWGLIFKDGCNGNILGYVVFYCEDIFGLWFECDVSLVYVKELMGLMSGKLYFVRVVGYMKIG